MSTYAAVRPVIPPPIIAIFMEALYHGHVCCILLLYMEGSNEQLGVKSPVVDSVGKKVSALYEKFVRIPVSDEVIKSFDRIANTFQSEKGKRMIESLRPIIPTLAKVGEGVSAAFDVVCGVVGFGSGVKDVRENFAARKTNIPPVDKAIASPKWINNIFVGVSKAIGIPAFALVARPFSRAAFYSARALGAVGEVVGRNVDQILLRKEQKLKKV